MNQRDAIEGAFRRLPLLEGMEVCLKSAVNILADVDCTGPGIHAAEIYLSRLARQLKVDKGLSAGVWLVAENGNEVVISSQNPPVSEAVIRIDKKLLQAIYVDRIP